MEKGRGISIRNSLSCVLLEWVERLALVGKGWLQRYHVEWKGGGLGDL